MYNEYSPSDLSSPHIDKYWEFKGNTSKDSHFDNLLSIAISAGYYDVRHLSREIKRMSGNTPVPFIAAPQPKDVTLTYINSSLL